MSYLLEARKQRTPQWNRARRHNSVPSGVCVIHTAEGNGANNVLDWILTRSDYGSYHRLCDATSTLKLAPWSGETFHCRFTNPHSVGISAAVKAADWPALYKAGTGQKIIDRMAIEAADFVTYMKGRGVTVPVKRISRAEALAKKPGFLAHEDTDPGRRTDPGKDFDWDYFFERIRHHLGQTTATTPAPAPVVSTGLTLPKKGEPYYGRVIDGQPGPYTYAALQQFLADRQYYDRVVDGDPGPYTWRGMQQFLADRNFYDRVIDGQPGHYTYAGLQRFLQANGWYKRVIDGQPGVYTWRALQDYLARRTTK
ncbi:peptidoglycan recognition protein family protein [Flaviflexus massiliensis]|uniref:peptidoglycan recognition protein family protein n=1 Tax=Flaviflexus massiliensis TaxID=1522309 RepID=UPI0006D54599|nr:hypothetical protein [Flaviflexus massiliensis]